MVKVSKGMRAAKAAKETAHGTKHVDLPVATRREADGGYQDQSGQWYYWRSLRVRPSGEVLAWDDVAGHYTRLHSLTPEQLAEARRLAGVDV